MRAETFGPNPNGDQNKGWTLLAVCWAFVICALITTILRIWIRSRLTRNLGIDDWVMVFAMVRLTLHSLYASFETDLFSSQPSLEPASSQRVSAMASDATNTISPPPSAEHLRR